MIHNLKYLLKQSSSHKRNTNVPAFKSINEFSPKVLNKGALLVHRKAHLLQAFFPTHQTVMVPSYFEENLEP